MVSPFSLLINSGPYNNNHKSILNNVIDKQSLTTIDIDNRSCLFIGLIRL